MQGSSPRMRGTPCRTGACIPPPGLIPTYAGNTPVAVAAAQVRRAHPHVCGEHDYFRAVRVALWGSSPRMRGTRGPVPKRTENRGLIPTYAGNTRIEPLQRRLPWAHPHVCGEHGLYASQPVNMSGSSPRMRGTLFQGHVAPGTSGLIPTYAGNT